MLTKIIEKRNHIILIIIIILLIGIAIRNQKTNEYSETYNYFDENITIKLYNNVTKTTFNDIDKILKEYNGFYQNPNQNTNKKFIKLLKYGKELYTESNGLIDITSAKLEKAIEEGRSYEFKSNINDLDFNNKKSLTNININMIIGSYAINDVVTYLKQNNIDQYIINEDGNIIAGKSYKKQKYKISIQDSNANLVKIVSLENKVLMVKGNTTKFKPYMINPITSSKNTKNNLIAVIGKDINETNKIANILYLMDIEEGKDFIKKYNVSALWHTKEKDTYTSANFKKYIIK